MSWVQILSISLKFIIFIKEIFLNLVTSKMSKISLSDLDKYEGENYLEKFKKKQKTNVKKKREKVNKRKGYIDLSQLD